MQSSKAPADGSRNWLSVAEFALEVGMSQMTVYRLIDKGEIPAVRLGRRLVVPGGVLEQLAAAALSNGGTVNVADWTFGALP